MTAADLFAGDARRVGLNRCYYCGSFCDDMHAVDDFVKPTFTNRDIVSFPGSQFVCVGCALSLGIGDDKMEMIDGSFKVRENERGMQPRLYSWVLTEGKKLAASKAHIKQLRGIVIDSPEPPFAIILADSGQKQLIFRAPIALNKNNYPLLLEDERINVDVEVLHDLLELTSKICAATGKPALLGDLKYISFSRYEEYFGDTTGLERWIRIREAPLSRLAAWLSPSREEAKCEYPGIERGKVSAATGRANRSGSSDSGGNEGRNKSGGDQFCLDFGEPIRRQP
jgi:hypothetical protein